MCGVWGLLNEIGPRRLKNNTIQVKLRSKNLDRGRRPAAAAAHLKKRRIDVEVRFFSRQL
jgi:hypothetical protein